jgi:hypothetical protein
MWQGGFRGRSGPRSTWRVTAHNRSVFDWDRVLREGCYASTAKGPVSQFDGELIVDNPKFVARERAMRMDDVFLRVDDLKD